MEEVKKGPVNRCFSPQQREELIKESLKAAHEKKRREDANKVLRNLALRLHCQGKLSKIVKAVEMQVKKGLLPIWVFETLIERLESQRAKNELSDQEIVDLEDGKSFLKQFRQ